MGHTAGGPVLFDSRGCKPSFRRRIGLRQVVAWAALAVWPWQTAQWASGNEMPATVPGVAAAEIASPGGNVEGQLIPSLGVAPGLIQPAKLQEEPRQPILRPRPELVPETPLPPTAAEFAARALGPGGVELSTLARRRFAIGAPTMDIVFGVEAKRRVTTDAGSLLGTAPTVLGVGVQRRTPIVTDPRVRGSRVGQLAASGSYWVPARIDLDTVLSKIDSRVVGDMIVFKGPYSVLYGPGLEHVDVQLLPSPRPAGGFQVHGSSSFDFKTNGQQWYGRQTVWGGNEAWGFRAGYGHRTGNDYRTGSGTDIPASYNSRDVDLALGADLPADHQIEFHLLRLDQTGVEYPGQAFDMDYLVADGYEIQYAVENRSLFDRLDFDVWYNRTRFEGNAQEPGKRRQFPFLDFLQYEGFTDVDSMSTGFRLATTWEDRCGGSLTLGVDLRYLRRELNEISSGRYDLTVFEDVNSPIPRSEWNNPGIFLQRILPVT
jgi:iron complex outermembrane receptor protein